MEKTGTVVPPRSAALFKLSLCLHLSPIEFLANIIWRYKFSQIDVLICRDSIVELFEIGFYGEIVGKAFIL